MFKGCCWVILLIVKGYFQLEVKSCCRVMWKTKKVETLYNGRVLNELISTMPYSGNNIILGRMWFAYAAEQAPTGAAGKILASCSSQFVFPHFSRLSLPALAPLISTSLVSCVQLCLQTWLQ